MLDIDTIEYHTTYPNGMTQLHVLSLASMGDWLHVSRDDCEEGLWTSGVPAVPDNRAKEELERTFSPISEQLGLGHPPISFNVRGLLGHAGYFDTGAWREDLVYGIKTHVYKNSEGDVIHLKRALIS